MGVFLAVIVIMAVVATYARIQEELMRKHERENSERG